VPDRPLLRLPEPVAANPPRPPRGGTAVTKPTRERQKERLGSRLERLGQIAANPQEIMQLRSDPQSIAPERAIVFEVAGSIAEFYQRAADIGLEYLADDEREFAPDNDFQVKDKPEEEVVGRIYLAMPDVGALQELIRLWNRYISGGRMPNGFAVWSKLFSLLRDIRPWGPQDRLPPETLEFWQERLRSNPDEAVRFEVEFWFRENPDVRSRVLTSFSTALRALGGELVAHSVIAEIRYDAALVDLPVGRVADLLNDPTITLAAVDEIMFIRPQTMAEYGIADETEAGADVSVGGDPTELPPIVAMIDGLPIQNHQRLAGRLLVDDPESFETGYAAATRRHGTEMASLILHGDLNATGSSLSRRIYVRPVLRPTPDGQHERTPVDMLVVDLIYRAVRRIKEGEGSTPAAAPSVVLVNLSLGDPNRLFAGVMSPWARLLDYLAYKYRVLFLVSAGNIYDPLELSEYQTWGEFVSASVEDRERAIFRSINANRSRRSLLSPAEAMNVLTVGAAHRDSVAPGRELPLALDPTDVGHLPNISSALGLGFRRVIKPDLLLDGGREYVRLKSTHPLVVEPVRVTGRAFGLLAAAPDPQGADLSRTMLTWGTSAATALATHVGHGIFDVLMDREGGSRHADTPQEYQALLVKALLVHGSSWGDRWPMLEELVGGEHASKKDDVSRILGHGILDAMRVKECTTGRATLVGVGEVKTGDASLYRVPLPPSLDGVSEFRAVTVTAAWFSPINPRHQGYRMAALEAGPGGDQSMSLGVSRAKAQPNHHAIRRGTVFHDRREGERASAYVDNGDLLIRVAARASAGEYDALVPYALAVSIEVGVTSQVQVYDEVRAAIEAQILPPVTI